MDQIANQNVAPSSAPAENRVLPQHIATAVRHTGKTPPSDIKDPDNSNVTPELDLLLTSEHKNNKNKDLENLGDRITNFKNPSPGTASSCIGIEPTFPIQVMNSPQIAGLGTSRTQLQSVLTVSDEEEEGELVDEYEKKGKKGATPEKFEGSYGLPAIIGADMKDFLKSMKPMKFTKTDNAASRLIQKFRKSLVCPKCGSLHGHTSQGTASNQYGGTAPFKCRSSVPQLLMMLPHEVICAVGKVHREFCIKDAQLFASWISSSKAEQKDSILKRLKQDMDIDKLEEISIEDECIADSQDFDMSNEEIQIENSQFKDIKKNFDSSTDVNNYSDAEFRSVVIDEILSLRKRLTELLDENKALRQENAVLKKYRPSQIDLSPKQLPNSTTSLKTAVSYSEITKAHTPRQITIKRSRREVGPNVEIQIKPRPTVDLSLFIANESDKNKEKFQESSKLAFVYFKGLIRRPQSEYRALLDQIGFGGYKARDILFLSNDFLQVLTYEDCIAELVEKIKIHFPTAKHVIDADPTDPLNYEEHGNLSRKYLEAQYFATMQGAVQRFKKLASERPVLTRTLHFLEKVVETKNSKYEKAPNKPKIFLMNNFLVLQDLQDSITPPINLDAASSPSDMETEPISVVHEVLTQVPMETSL